MSSCHPFFLSLYMFPPPSSSSSNNQLLSFSPSSPTLAFLSLPHLTIFHPLVPLSSLHTSATNACIPTHCCVLAQAYNCDVMLRLQILINCYEKKTKQQHYMRNRCRGLISDVCINGFLLWLAYRGEGSKR